MNEDFKIFIQSQNQTQNPKCNPKPNINRIQISLIIYYEENYSK